MIEIVEKDHCSGCHACYSICPKTCIEMVEDAEGFKYPKVDKSKCIGCDLCDRVCHYKKVNNKCFVPDVYAVVNNDESIKMQSSSGGAFSLIAEWIIDKGGLVIGTAFDRDFNVKHIIVDNKEDLSRLRGSKYVQSNIGDVLKATKSLLKNGKIVLFTGTPCQIEGLLLYLKDNYENLYTMDFICHGVPSPKIWGNYVSYQKERLGNIRNISFRDKTYGWKNFSMRIDVENKESYVKDKWNDPFLNGFLSNLFLRPSCHNCCVKHTHHMSDITIGDFWKVEELLESDFKYGCSAFVINSAKGSKIFENIRNNMIFEKMSIESVVANNSNYTKSAQNTLQRKKAFKYINEHDFEKYIHKCNHLTIWERIIYRIIQK